MVNLLFLYKVMEVINCFYNKYSVNILAIILALFIVFIFNSIINFFNNIWYSNTKNSINVKENEEILVENNIEEYDIQNNEVENNIEEYDIQNNEVENNDLNENINIEIDEKQYMTENLEINTGEKWCLEIEKIGLIAEISEGTDEKTLDYFIGHFSNTPVKVGNVGLAAHNRGYRNNYFSRLKELEKGDKINYYINGNKFIYEVEEILIIYETDWSMFENTNDNRITMITCVENRDKYRLCVQAIRVKEE